MDKERAKELNKLNIRRAIAEVSASTRPVSTVQLEIQTQKLHKSSVSRVVIDHATAARLEDNSLRLQNADLGVRFSLHDRNEQPAISAEPQLGKQELAFLQMYLRYDAKKQQVIVTSNVEVADNYQGEDCQGYGLGSAFMPKPGYDMREEAIRAVVATHYPEATSIVLSLKDFAHGKAGKDRQQWTSNLAEQAGYESVQGHLIKTIHLAD